MTADWLFRTEATRCQKRKRDMRRCLVDVRLFPRHGHTYEASDGSSVADRRGGETS